VDGWLLGLDVEFVMLQCALGWCMPWGIGCSGWGCRVAGLLLEQGSAASVKSAGVRSRIAWQGSCREVLE
jgi:hypothetical protein